MTKRNRSLVMILPVLLILAACSSIQLPGSVTQPDAQAQSTSQAAQGFNPANQPVESKLAMGTLKLEGTDQAITAQQAKDLLPLWKAVKSLGSSSTASTDEINALYTQIKETMSPEQVQAVETMTISREDMTALMEKYNIEMPQAQDRAAGSGLTEEQRATRIAQFAAQGGGATRGNGGQGGFVGGPPDGGGVPGGGFPADGTGGTNGGQFSAQRTPVPGQTNRGMRGGFNNIFLDPLIKLLEERANS